MQNTQEVNVRVAVRVRPLLPKEKLAGETSCVKIQPKSKQLVIGKDRVFTFDHVLSSKCTQDQVYEICVDSLVKSCFEGYNATVFAYGQTGSGKTYTIGGGNIATQVEEDFGIIPRAVRHMFEHMQNNKNRDYIIKVSYVEIYKEELRDLLDLDTPTKDMHIREDDQGNTIITGANEIECETMEEVMTYLEQGSAFRHTGSTQMNEHSSRSHSVFTVLIEQRWTDTEDGDVEQPRPKTNESSDLLSEDNGDIEHYVCAKFHFVDLAGSERAHRTGNVGDRLKESVHINSGLLALGNVISALGDVKKKVSHIPYRDSKITRILKDSLGGNAKTVMICCISPASSSFDESLNALKYANRARNIKNKPIVNRDPQSLRFEKMQSEIKALREELQRQRTSLMSGNLSDLDIEKAIKDAGQVKHLEDNVIRLQTECAHYRMIAEEAYKQLIDLQDRNILSQSQNIRLSEWMELMEEIKNKVPSTLSKEAWESQAIATLQNELKQCKNDLKSDEEIFAEKAKELNALQDRIAELEEVNSDYSHQIEELQERLKQQEELLVDKQMIIEELQAKLSDMEQQPLAIDSSVERLSGPPTTSRRAKSVPAQFLGDRSLKKDEVARNIHTSPALFSLERVMQGFRARSQLLVSRLEDSDDVLQPDFEDDVFDGAEDGQTEGETNGQCSEDRYAFDRNEKQRGTYRVKRPKVRKAMLSMNVTERDTVNMLRQSQTDDEKLLSAGPGGSTRSRLKRNRTFSKGEMTKLVSNTELQKKKLKQTELDVRQSTQKMRDLNINIKMKEQLIKELVKTSKEAQSMNKEYQEKIQNLEKEKQETVTELHSLQAALQELESRGQQDKAEKERLQIEFRKKMELAKTKIHALQKKQKETEKIASITSHAGKRIQELEQAIEQMKQQQDQLQKRLKEEMARKVKLERDMQKEQQRIKELEVHSEQQKKVLRIKTEEMTAMQRRLRSNSSSTSVNSDEQMRLDEQKKWLDQEIEKVLEQRRHIEELEKELEKREDIISKKEAMLAERSELEMKKLRSSQLLNKDILLVTNKLDVIDKKIEEKSQEVATTPRGDVQAQLRDELQKLKHSRERLSKQREVLDAKLRDGTILTPQEERRLIELDEAVEALDAAIEYKNEVINSKREEIRRSVAIIEQSEEHFMSKLKTLSATETKALLTKYFEKVIDLREAERKKDLLCSELEMKVDEQERLIHELEASLQRSLLEKDRKLTSQQQEYEKKIQALMHQLAEVEQNKSGSARSDTDSSNKQDATIKQLETKILQLEKELYYYKKTSRELKKKLRELLAENLSARGYECLDTDRSDNVDNALSSPQDSSGRTTPRSASSYSKSGSQASIRNGDVGSANQGAADSREKLNQIRDGAASIRISRKDLRRMSQEEVLLRKSAAETRHSDIPKDSLELAKNPWS